MKKLLLALALLPMALFGATVAPINVQKAGDGSNGLTANLDVPTTLTLTIDAGGTLTIQSGATVNFPAGFIPWAAVNKTGSSLADLTTRSASDLSSGTVPIGRLYTTAVGYNITGGAVLDAIASLTPSGSQFFQRNSGNTAYQWATISPVITLGSDLTGNVTLTNLTSGTLNGTVAKVNGVAYGTAPSTNTVPVVTGANTITYEAVPNVALANSAITIGGASTSLGGTVTATTILDSIGSTRGSVLERGAAGWAAITPGTSGLPFTSNGAAADPSYQALSLTAAVSGILPGANGGTGVNNTGKTITIGGNVSTGGAVTTGGALTISGAFGTTFTVSALTSVTLPTSGTLVGSADTGTVTNTMLAGSIANAKLLNSSVTIGSTSVALGATVSTFAGVTLTSPTLTTPSLGVATATSINGLTLTANATGFSVAGGTTSKTLTVSNSLTLAGTDATTMTFPGTSATIARTDAANTFTGASSTTSWAETTPVITGGLSASGAGANTFVGSSGTFITSTGANTLSGATTINDAATPSLTTAAGKTNTGFVLIQGKTSGGLKFLPVDAAAQTVTVSLAAQTTGASTLTIPDQAGTSRNFVFDTLTQTLTNKTLGSSTSVTNSITYTAGVRQTFAPNATTPGLNSGTVSADPSTPSNGDLWYNTTTNKLTAYINGAVVQLGSGGGGGTVTNTGGALTANALVLGAGGSDTKVAAGIITDGTSKITLGVNTTTLGSVKMFGNTSGDATIQPAAIAGTATVVTLPNASSTLPIFPQEITFTGPTAPRTITLPDAAFTVARTDAANTFTGASTGTSWTLTTVVLAGGLTASGSGTNDFSASTGTFKTSTGANTLSGATTINDATSPNLILASGKTNTGTITINGKTSGSLVITTADATAQAVTVSLAAQTTGAATLTIPNFANVSDTFSFVTLAQTLANKTLTSPVINGATSSGSTSLNFSGNTGTFLTSTGANTLSGATTIADATTPSLTTASGKTNTGFVLIQGKTSGGLKLLSADAAAQTVTVNLAAQTTGASTLTVPDQAGTSRNFVFDTLAQTLSSKTLTTPVIASGLTASGSTANDFSASTATFLTSTGANTLNGAVTVNDATTPSITLTNGKTNTGFFQVNGKTSGAFKINTVDATAQTVTMQLAAQTTGAATLTIPDQAGTSRNFVFDTLAQTLTNKTLTSPVINGATSSGSTSIDFSGNTAAFKTSTGATTLGSSASTTGAFTDAKGEVRLIPQNSQSAAYTTVLADEGKHILHPSADTTARTFTIDSNANVAYPIGTAITFVNQNAAGTITIAITSDTMRLAGAGTTGSRTLTANGVATALKIATTEWIISGTNLN